MNDDDYKHLFRLPLPQLPVSVREKIDAVGGVSAIEYANLNRALASDEVMNEIGTARLASGDVLVAMRASLPGVTLDMIRWWFWWQAQESRRYQVWYPGAHRSISFNRKSKSYFENSFKGFLENTQYPRESIGRVALRLSIHFVTPDSFGIENVHQDDSKRAIVCANVGLLRGLVRHTKMMHVFNQAETGLELTSRFWLGNGLPEPVKPLVANRNQAREMAAHCWTEYTRLGEILPYIWARAR